MVIPGISSRRSSFKVNKQLETDKENDQLDIDNNNLNTPPSKVKNPGYYNKVSSRAAQSQKEGGNFAE